VENGASSWKSSNSIYWYNTATNGKVFGGTTREVSYSDIQNDGWPASGVTNCISIEPRFISTNEFSSDFVRLDSGSPCIDTGTSEGAPALDLAGQVRGRGLGYDMGVYEFRGPSVRVVQPNGGEHITINSPYKFTWETSPEATINVKVWLSTNEGVSWDTPITSEPLSHPSGLSTFEWTPTTAFVSKKCFISVEVSGAISGINNYDKSNSIFEILRPLSTEVWVSWTTGSNTTGAGTVNNPYQTINFALTTVATGGTVYAFGGTYNENNINWSQFNNITLKASLETTPATIDAQTSGRGIIVTASTAANMTIEGFTIMNGRAPTPGLYAPGNHGGGIYKPVSGVISMINCILSNNYASNGSMGYGGAPNLGGNGGGIYTIGSAVLRNCVVSGNRAGNGYTSGNGGNGGGLYATYVSAVNCLYYSNYAGTSPGGGTGGDGGSIYTSSSTSSNINDCTFYANYSGNGTPGGNGGGADFAGGSSNNIINSIFSNNYAGGSGSQIYTGGTVNVKYSDIQNGTGGIGGSIGTYTGNISAEPNLTTDYSLGAGSPCIDTASSEAPSPDLAGNPRPHGYGNDMGVYEFQGPSIVVLQPNGGQTISALTTYNIVWKVSPESDEIRIRLSTDEGVSWIEPPITSEVKTSSGVSTYEWSVPVLPSTQCLISIEVLDADIWNCDKSDLKFTITYIIYPPESLTAEALPADIPTYVRLYWSASTSEVAFEGYYVYRGLTYETYEPSPLNATPTTEFFYEDRTVTAEEDYFYAIKTYGYGQYSAHSNDASAPLVTLTRSSTIDAPLSGGYTGGTHDAVPGAKIIFTMEYENIGFGPAANIIINDKIPAHTDYKTGSATGEAAISIKYSSNEGSSYNYAPGGTVDPAVTNISWEVENLYSGLLKLCTYEVVIK
jgi:uncharacterized repeat protein (TIGR01451 family)